MNAADPSDKSKVIVEFFGLDPSDELVYGTNYSVPLVNSFYSLVLDYGCSLTRSILLNGHMYITRTSLCFASNLKHDVFLVLFYLLLLFLSFLVEKIVDYYYRAFYLKAT